MQLVIDTAQTQVSVKHDCFFVHGRGQQRQISPKRITSIAITANVLVSASAMMLAAQHQVPIYYFDRAGQVQARTDSPYFSNLASLRRQQHLWAGSPAATAFVVDNLRLKFAQQGRLLAELAGPSQLLANAATAWQARADQALDQMAALAHLPVATARPTLMGLEGGVARAYWLLLARHLPAAQRPQGRSRRPALDPFNAVLNYLYGMTYALVEQAVLAAGLDPLAGALHTEGYGRPALVFDLIEPFRPLVDGLLARATAQGLLLPAHTETKADGHWLSKAGKRYWIPAYNAHAQEHHQFDGGQRTLAHHALHYAHQLAKQIKAYRHDVPDHL
jgi:CRISPR-associated protein Cas1